MTGSAGGASRGRKGKGSIHCAGSVFSLQPDLAWRPPGQLVQLLRLPEAARNWLRIPQGPSQSLSLGKYLARQSNPSGSLAESGWGPDHLDALSPQTAARRTPWPHLSHSSHDAAANTSPGPRWAGRTQIDSLSIWSDSDMDAGNCPIRGSAEKVG